MSKKLRTSGAKPDLVAADAVLDAASEDEQAFSGEENSEDGESEVEHEASSDEEDENAPKKPAARPRKNSGSTHAEEENGSNRGSAEEEDEEASTSESETPSDEDTENLEYGTESDDSDDEAEKNRIGNVPLAWYEDQDHIGYDIGGEKIAKTITKSEIDSLLNKFDNPDAWRTITDVKNQEEIVLTDKDLEAIHRIRNHMAPRGIDQHPFVVYDNPDAKLHPVGGGDVPKRRFMPSKWEGMKIKKLIRLYREGKIVPPQERDKKEKERVFDIWEEEQDLRKKAPTALIAPKLPLPGHAESFNPPEEYLFTEEEKREWEEMDESERPLNFIPQKYGQLRKVPAYPQLITERFNRCLDLYLVPRALKKRMNVEKESLLPKLPAPSDLRPFPMRVSVTYEGHNSLVRSVSVDRTGRFLATASDDNTCIVYEVETGRPCKRIRFESCCQAVAFHPRDSNILAVANEGNLYFANLDLVDEDEENIGTSTEEKLAVRAEVDAVQVDEEEKSDAEEADADDEEADDGEKKKKRKNAKPTLEQGGRKAQVVWEGVKPRTAHHKQGLRLLIKHDGLIRQITWHPHGNYCAVVSAAAKSVANQCIIHAFGNQKSIKPFGKSKGSAIQQCCFHPTKPLFFVCNQTSVRLYHLQKQQLVKQLISGAKWISSITVHPNGEHVVVGTYDRRVIWFDLELSNKPYKTLKYHDRGIRQVQFYPHSKENQHYPLLATASDDGTVHVLHAKVYSDFLTNPLIVPVRKLREHAKTPEGLGVLDCTWHPTRPWLFSSGADGKVFLWV